MKFLQVIHMTLISNLRNRLFLIMILFSFILLCASVLLGLLGQEQGLRILTDLGLSTIELLSLLTAVYLSVQLITDEIESRSIYLILTRSLTRNQYLISRFFGLVLSLLMSIIVMASIHLLILKLKGWNSAGEFWLYSISLALIAQKIILISSIALFFSLTMSSTVVALILSMGIWVLGHFSTEIKFLSSEIKSEMTRKIFKGIYLLLPNFQYLNARDLWDSVKPEILSFGFHGLVYVSTYCFIVLLFSCLAFRRKEF